MRYRSFLLPLILASGLGCSFLLQADAEQCDGDGDCIALFGLGRACKEGQCVRVAEPMEAAAPEEAAPPEPDCTPEQCAKEALPSICKPNSKTCSVLTSAVCPTVIGKTKEGLEAWKDPDSIVVAAIVPNILETEPYFQIFDLAVSEINELAFGLPPASGPDGGGVGRNRPIAMLFCKDTEGSGPLGQAAAAHALGTLGLQSLIWGSGPEELLNVWAEYANPNRAFVLNLAGYSRSLSGITDNNLWHLLPSLERLATFYGTVLTRMEAKARELSDAGPVRVVTISNLEPTSRTLRDELFQNTNVNVNDAGLVSNANQATHQDLVLTQDVDAASSQIAAFNPHIVISTVGPELIPVVHTAEGQLYTAAGTNAQEKLPRYLFAPFNISEEHLQGMFKTPDYPGAYLARHVAGVNAAGTVSPVKDAFRRAYDQRFPRDAGSDAGPAPAAHDYENVYDAAYFLAYAIAAASQTSIAPRPSGDQIGTGMTRLFSGPTVRVGRLDLANGLLEVSKPDRTVSLEGTLGPPRFDPTTHSREVDLSVYCVDNDLGQYVYRFDRLKLGDAGVLEGDWEAGCPENTAL